MPWTSPLPIASDPACFLAYVTYLSEPESTGFLNLDEGTGMEVETDQKSGFGGTAEKALSVRLRKLDFPLLSVSQHSLMIFNE